MWRRCVACLLACHDQLPLLLAATVVDFKTFVFVVAQVDILAAKIDVNTYHDNKSRSALHTAAFYDRSAVRFAPIFG
jgi:hypothetical protein